MERNEIFDVLLAPSQEIARKMMANSDLGLTQQEVGAVLGKDQATISRWLKIESSAERTGVHAE
jgi:hypothetical protein